MLNHNIQKGYFCFLKCELLLKKNEYVESIDAHCV